MALRDFVFPVYRVLFGRTTFLSFPWQPRFFVITDYAVTKTQTGGTRTSTFQVWLIGRSTFRERKNDIPVVPLATTVFRFHELCGNENAGRWNKDINLSGLVDREVNLPGTEERHPCRSPGSHGFRFYELCGNENAGRWNKDINLPLQQ